MYTKKLTKKMTADTKFAIAAAALMVSGIYDPQTFHLGVKDAALRSLDVDRRPSPVSDRLGHQRLLRTSPLTPIPPAC